MPQSLSSKAGAILVFIASLVGLGVALYAYFAPLTGVNGSIGALVVILACIALAVMALILAAVNSRGALIALRILLLVGLVGTCVAGLLLHQWWIGVAMVVGLLGLILDMARHGSNANRFVYS
ncbi:hypothetical protein [Halomonas sp. PR-M31]|uniref:hypothetical protein n=1 Tax=Halomonas sp. PR-M31 TaxID=1471202 RepID=UPI000650D9F8|nr:hypothetical protein [Halomonas sp. PR-M31]